MNKEIWKQSKNSDQLRGTKIKVGQRWLILMKLNIQLERYIVV